MKISRRRGKTGVILSMKGDCTVAGARELREALSSVLDEAAGVVLDVKGVGEADITFLQLLLAADAYAREQGRLLSLTGPIPEGFMRAATLTGVCRRQDFRELLARSGLALNA